jgi:hypothetical protein
LFTLLDTVNERSHIQGGDFAQANWIDLGVAVDRAHQDRAATPDLNWRRAVDAGDKLLRIFPCQSLRQIFVRVDTGCVDGFSNARRTPTSTAGIAKKRAQRLYMERDGGPLPPGPPRYW